MLFYGKGAIIEINYTFHSLGSVYAVQTGRMKGGAMAIFKTWLLPWPQSSDAAV